MKGMCRNWLKENVNCVSREFTTENIFLNILMLARCHESIKEREVRCLWKDISQSHKTEEPELWMPDICGKPVLCEKKIQPTTHTHLLFQLRKA